MKIQKYTILLLSLLLISACEEWKEIQEPSDAISFKVTTSQNPLTKANNAENETHRIPMLSESTIPMIAVCKTSDNEIVEEEVETRADNAERYSSTSAFSSQSFGLWGWNTSSNPDEVVYDNETVTKVNDKWSPATAKNWKYNKEYCFEALYPKINTASLGSTGITSFHADANPANLTFSYKHDNTLGADYDYMLAYYEGKGQEDGAKLKFTHPFTCVKFAAGEGVTISSIQLSNLYLDASCSVTKNSGTDDNGDFYTYSWTPSANRHSISCNVNNELILIPQNLTTANVIINVSFSISGISFNSSVTLDNGMWLAGKVYTYTFSVNQDVSVNVTCSSKGNLANPPVIVNTGASKAYIRATIVGGIYDSNDVLIEPWVEGTGGFFAVKPGTNWVQVGNYYYYQDPVDSQETIPNPLFASFYLNKSLLIGQEFRLEVLAQAILWDENKAYAKAAWGSNIDTDAGLN